ncbi:MAG: maleylpyruvate isomerase family mycothiol-dependent enzyme [Actinomycetota bacterium]|nr:maleylpyruvate isomerase family mycothiol-dependent enzyme [Actinomycetota bacterium]
MSFERGTLLGVAYAERQRLGRTIQYAPPETWEKPSACDGWWNRDVMAHLAASDTAAAQIMKGDPAEELEEYRAGLGDAEFTVDGFNAWTVDRRSGLPVREILTTWGRAAEAFLAYAALLSEDDWESKRFAWLAGDIAARYLVQTRVVEWWLHGEDVRATNGLGPQWQHWPIHLTIDLGVRMLPWALARAGFELTGRSVRVEVEGAGEGSWHWGLGAGEVPPDRRQPDAVIEGRAPQLALVAGRRLAPEEVLGSGAIVLGGDVDLAEVVLRHIRAYP